MLKWCSCSTSVVVPVNLIVLTWNWYRTVRVWAGKLQLIYNRVFLSLSFPQSVVCLVSVITMILRLWSLAAENALWQLVHSNIWICVCKGLLVHWSWSINTFPSHTNQFIYSIVCICVFGKTELLAVCGNFGCVFYIVTRIQTYCLLADHRSSKPRLMLLRSVTVHWCWSDIVAEINATVNKADRVKIAFCIPTGASSFIWSLRLLLTLHYMCSCTCKYIHVNVTKVLLKERESCAPITLILYFNL